MEKKVRIRTSVDDLDEDLATALTLDMALMDYADLRCAFKRSRTLFGDGDEGISRTGSEMGPYECALLFVNRV